MPARAGTEPELGIADLVACLEILRCLGVAFGTGGQPDRAGHLLGAAEVLRELLEHLETPVRPGLPAPVGLGAGRRTPESGRLSNGEDFPDSRPRPPDGRARSKTEQVGAGRARGHPFPRPLLSPRERDVFALLVEGYSNAAIADALRIGRRTAETHVANILGKIGVSSRAAAIAYAIRHDLIV